MKVVEIYTLSRENLERSLDELDELDTKPRDHRLFVSSVFYDAWVANHGSAPPYWVRLSSDRVRKS